MKKTLIFLLIILNIFILYAHFIEPYWVETVFHSVPLRPAAQAYHGLTIVHLSDLHLKSYGWYQEWLAKKINALSADIICITGDLSAPNHNFIHAIQFINSLDARMGIFIVFGNSDYTNVSSFYQNMKTTPFKHGVYLLRNEILKTAYNNQTVLIVGIDDPATGRDRISNIPSLLDKESLKITLVHSYQSPLDKQINDVDLVLAGHTHGGQVKIIPPNLIIKLASSVFSEFKHPFPFYEGFHRNNNTWVNVSRGLGMSLLPVRFLCRPEITVLTFE